MGKFNKNHQRNKSNIYLLDFIEFLLAASLTSSKDPVRKIELFFSMYDIDNNGLIDENEMRSFVEVCYSKYSSYEICFFFFI
jgi:Ca2+-binding EF-hand superfamily protein